MLSRAKLAFVTAALLAAIRPALAQTPNGPGKLSSGDTQRTQSGLPPALIPKNVDLSKLTPAEAALEKRRLADQRIRTIGFGLIGYEDKHLKMPARASFDKDGKPLLSWRVHILPFLNETDLYKQFHLDEPWDSEHNKKLLEKIPDFYRDPSQETPAGTTVYQAVVGNHLAFEGDKGIGLASVVDGTRQTVTVVEAAAENAVPWTKPADWEPDLNNATKGLADVLPDHTFHCVFFDGHSMAFKKSVDSEEFRKILTRRGGETISLDVGTKALIGWKDTLPQQIAPPPVARTKRDVSKLTPAERPLEERSQSLDNIKKIGLGLLEHEFKNRVLPARASFDKDGKPLLSWRVTILPFLGEGALYGQFHLDEPWDSDHNKTLLEKIPACYRNPSQPTPAGLTVYQAVVGKGLGFEGDKALNSAAMRDGTSTTVALVETAAENAVPWTKPADWEPDLDSAMIGLAEVPPTMTFQFVFFNGQAMEVTKKSIDPLKFRKALTRSGGDQYDFKK